MRGRGWSVGLVTALAVLAAACAEEGTDDGAADGGGGDARPADSGSRDAAGGSDATVITDAAREAAADTSTGTDASDGGASDSAADAPGDARADADAAASDAGSDSSPADAATDGSASDAGADSGASDAGPTDGAATDASTPDAAMDASVDASVPDTGAPVGPNFARETGATASATSTYTSYVASRVIDGNTGSSWYPASGSCTGPVAGVSSCASTSVTVTLAGARTIGRLVMYGNHDGYEDGYDVVTGRWEILDVSNGVLATYPVAPPLPGRDFTTIVTPPLANARAVRFVVLTGESDTPGFGEIEIYVN